MTTTKPAGKKTTAAQRLDAVGIDAVCDMILEDLSYTQIAHKCGVLQSQLSKWIADSNDNSARAREARIATAEVNDGLALKVLQDLPPDATPAQIAQAREIASHRRWRASKRDPRSYGDKIEQVHQNPDGTALDLTVNFISPDLK